MWTRHISRLPVQTTFRQIVFLCEGLRSCECEEFVFVVASRTELIVQIGVVLHGKFLENRGYHIIASMGWNQMPMSRLRCEGVSNA